MSTSKQQAVLSQQPQPMAPPPLPPIHKIGQPDMFVDMIEGPVMSVGVGQKENSRTFVLHCRLLAQHSLYVHNCLYPSQSSFESTKKRKLSQVSCERDPAKNTARTEGANVVIKVESDIDGNETKEEKEGPMVHIQLPDVDPIIFGLFLHYIYKDTYPRNVDGFWPSGAHQHYSRPATTLDAVSQVSRQHPTVNLPIHTESAKRPRMHPGTCSSTNVPGTSTTAHHSSQVSTSAINSKATDKPILPIPTQQPSHILSTSLPLTPNPIPPPPPPSTLQLANTSLYSSHTPTSIQAHFLGYRLGSCAFINYTITRIHSAIGTSFLLVPHTVYVIWSRTRSLPQAPLRRLVLDILITYWSRPDPRVRRSYIYSDARWWEMLFDHCKDLRNEFIRGMQNRVKIGGAEAYHITKKMVVDSNWEQVGKGQQEGANAGPHASSRTGSVAGEELEAVGKGT